MSYSTHTLFVQTLPKVEIDLVCDVGCLDARDSIGFRKIFPKATVIAFEANKRNYHRIQNNAEVANRGIVVYNCAITNQNGSIAFYDYHEPDVVRNGMGSTLMREHMAAKETYTVEARRLDDFILENFPGKSKIALWIDVEGAAYHVLEGIEKIKDRVQVIHTELELQSLFKEQKLRPHITALLDGFGFKEIGFVPHASNKLGDAVFLRKAHLKEAASHIRYIKLRSQLSSLVQTIKRRLK